MNGNDYCDRKAEKMSASPHIPSVWWCKILRARYFAGVKILFLRPTERSWCTVMPRLSIRRPTFGHTSPIFSLTAGVWLGDFSKAAIPALINFFAFPESRVQSLIMISDEPAGDAGRNLLRS